jgi:hypothetical protein
MRAALAGIGLAVMSRGNSQAFGRCGWRHFGSSVEVIGGPVGDGLLPLERDEFTSAHSLS